MTDPTAIYETEIKKKARSYLTDRVQHPVRQVLTLPSRDALCAEEFKHLYGKDCHVTGIDISEQLVRAYDSSVVDLMLHGNAFDLDSDKPFGRAVWKPTMASQQGHTHGQRRLERDHMIETKFDLMFLDFTALLSMEHAGRARLICERRAADLATVGLTFTIDRRMARDEQLCVLAEATPHGWTPHPPFFYENKPSSMVLLVLSR